MWNRMRVRMVIRIVLQGVHSAHICMDEPRLRGRVVNWPARTRTLPQTLPLTLTHRTQLSVSSSSTKSRAKDLPVPLLLPLRPPFFPLPLFPLPPSREMRQVSSRGLSLDQACVPMPGHGGCDRNCGEKCLGEATAGCRADVDAVGAAAVALCPLSLVAVAAMAAAAAAYCAPPALVAKVEQGPPPCRAPRTSEPVPPYDWTCSHLRR